MELGELSIRVDEERRVGRIREGEGRARGAGVAGATNVLPRLTSLEHESALAIIPGAQASPAPPDEVLLDGPGAEAEGSLMKGVETLRSLETPVRRL